MVGAIGHYTQLKSSSLVFGLDNDCFNHIMRLQCLSRFLEIVMLKLTHYTELFFERHQLNSCSLLQVNNKLVNVF